MLCICLFLFARPLCLRNPAAPPASRKKQVKIKPGNTEYAALMHDAGKLCSPDAVLQNLSSLHEKKRKITKMHAGIG